MPLGVPLITEAEKLIKANPLNLGSGSADAGKRRWNPRSRESRLPGLRGFCIFEAIN